MPNIFIPDEIKAKKGTLRKCRVNKSKPQFQKLDLDSLKVPSHLNRWGKSFYKKIFEILVDSDVLTISDLDSLEILASEYGKYLEAQNQLKSEGYVIQGINKNGSTYLMSSPWVNIANNAFKNYQSLMGKFGLSPSERSKISINHNKPENDPLQEFFKN